MVIYITILVTSEKLNQTQMGKLLDVYPDGNSKSSSFFCSIKENDSRIQQIISLLEGWGMMPGDSSGSLRITNKYYYAICRDYATSDYDSSQYLVPLGQPYTDTGTNTYCDGSGKYRIPRHYFKKKEFHGLVKP